MSKILITCPHCQHSKATDRSRIPANVKRVKCPICSESFALAEDCSEATAPATPQPPEEGSDSRLPEPESDQHPVRAAAIERLETDQSRRVDFTFTGTAKEYFGIWIVNTLLKILTLGIYSPWAKVRKRRYFYGCTSLDGMNFDYLANPIALLKGWLIGAALFLLYTYGANFNQILSMIAGLLIFILMPWVIVRSRLFNNRNSAHRNIRFNFYPDYKGSYFAYLWLPLLTPFTAGLLAPYMLYRQKQFLIDNNSYGKTSFAFSATGKDFYLLSLRAFGIVILVVICWAVMFSAVGPLIPGFASNAGQGAPLMAFILPIFLVLSYLLIGVYFYVRLSNLTWNHTRLGKHRFSSTLRFRDMLWIFISNGAAIIASFGLLTPWASIRLTRYRMQNLALDAQGDLSEFEMANKADVSAAGEEIGDIFGMDIGL